MSHQHKAAPTPRMDRLVCVLAITIASSTSLSVAQGASNHQPAGASASLAQALSGHWTMKGKFRNTPEMNWIPTRSSLVASQKLGRNLVIRDIEAAQVNLFALDWITYDENSGVVQYFYASNQSPTALIFEGTCEDECRHLEMQQLCGPRTNNYGCSGRTTLTFESSDVFVARDFRPGPNGEEFMSREVYYTRSGTGER